MKFKNPKTLMWPVGAVLLTLVAIGLVVFFLPKGQARKFELQPIKVGILHSLSGTMATSESPLKDVALMTIAQINSSGGVMGRQLEPVVMDPASDWPTFAKMSRKLLAEDKVAVVFGCWTSVSRKTALPVFEELNGLLFYPVQYEGEATAATAPKLPWMAWMPCGSSDCSHPR